MLKLTMLPSASMHDFKWYKITKDTWLMQAIVKYFLIPFVFSIPQLAFHTDDICIH